MADLVRREGLEDEIVLDSAGTGAWHMGSPPDERASATATARGLTLGGVARRVELSDFDEFDLILAMDRSNLGDLRALAPSEQARTKVHLLREFDPEASGDLDVPDPYYGGPGGFEHVFDLVTAACEGLLAEIRAGSL